MAGSSGSQKRREWQRRMTRFEEAQQPVAAFCRKEGVSVPSFYCWRKRLLRRPGPADEVASAGFRPVRLPFADLSRAGLLCRVRLADC